METKCAVYKMGSEKKGIFLFSNHIFPFDFSTLNCFLSFVLKFCLRLLAEVECSSLTWFILLFTRFNALGFCAFGENGYAIRELKPKKKYTCWDFAFFHRAFIHFEHSFFSLSLCFTTNGSFFLLLFLHFFLFIHFNKTTCYSHGMLLFCECPLIFLILHFVSWNVHIWAVGEWITKKEKKKSFHGRKEKDIILVNHFGSFSSVRFSIFQPLIWFGGNAVQSY